MHQAVRHDHVRLDVGRPLEALDAERVEHLEHEAEASNGYCVGVDVDAVNLVERATCKVGDVLGRRLLLPTPEEPTERAEEEVARPAGRVDEAHVP